jgi:hemoglobin-like flavoprotein
MTGGAGERQIAGMTPEQITLVDDTSASLREHMATVAADFYRRLFAAEPSLEALFGGDPAQQRHTFARELGVIVSAIRDHEVFRSQAATLGERHRGYGVRAVDYGRARPALLAALATALGPAWTPAVEEAWGLAYNLTVEVMITESDDHHGATRSP